MRLVRLIEEKECLKFLKGPNHINEIYYNYIYIYKIKIGPSGGSGPHLGPSLVWTNKEKIGFFFFEEMFKKRKEGVENKWMMWLNRNVTTINATLQLIYI